MFHVVAVQGATGKTGSATVRALLKRGIKVRAGFRTENATTKQLAAAGAELVKFDVYDEAAVAAALSGATAVVIVPPETPDRIEVFDRTLAAAKNAKTVQRVVLIGGLVVDYGTHLRLSHDWTTMEGRLVESGLPYTILRNAAFMETMLGSADTIQQGGFYFPMADAAVNWVAVDDIGEAAAAAIITPDAANKLYRIDGPEPVTGAQVAELFSKHCGHPVQYFSPRHDVAKQSMVDKGIPAPFAEAILEMWGAIIAYKGRLDYDDFEHLVGHKPIHMSEWIKEHAAAFQKP